MQHFRATTLAMLTSALFSAHAIGSALGGFPVRRDEPVLRTYDLRVRLTPHAQSGNTPSRNPGARLFVLAPSAGPVATLAASRSDSGAERTTTPSGESLLWTLPRLAEPATITATIRAAGAPIEFDDHAARSVPWPIRGWPEHASESLRPDAARDSDDPKARALIERWMGAQNRSVTPVTLAKYLAARTLTHAPATLEPMTALDESGGALGIRSEGPSRFADRAGTEFDMLRFYAAALRAANIPARLVVGLLDPEGAPARKHAWVEFFVYDERVRKGEWIPVDLISQRALDPTPPSLTKPWRHFGADRDGSLVPLAYGCPPATREPGLLASWWVESDAPTRPPVAAVTVRRAQPHAHASAKGPAPVASAN